IAVKAVADRHRARHHDADVEAAQELHLLDGNRDGRIGHRDGERHTSPPPMRYTVRCGFTASAARGVWTPDTSQVPGVPLRVKASGYWTSQLRGKPLLESAQN